MKFTLKYTQNKLKHEHMISYGGFHKWGISKMDGLWEKILLKWMIGGTSILGNHHMMISYVPSGKLA